MDIGVDFPHGQLHTKKSSQERSHFERRKGPGDDIYFSLADGLKNGFGVLFRIDEGIGGSQLAKEMGI